MKRFTRRELATVAVAALPVAAPAQTPQAPAQTDLAKAAAETNRRNSETLAKFEIPIATEPAFQFRP